MNGIVVIIPASDRFEGGSRLASRTFLGKPLVAHTIPRAREAAAVSRVVVLTDDAATAAAAHAHGADVARPLADLATAVIDLLERDGDSDPPRLLAILDPWSPLRPPGVVEAAVATLEREGADSLFSATRPRGAVWRRRAGRLTAVGGDSQEPPLGEPGEDLVENDSIRVCKPWVPRKHGGFLGGRIAVHLMDPLDALQIQEPGDFERLERLAEIPRPTAIPQGLERIRLLVLDFDGVMTDNRVWVHQDGTESVACHRGDGLGIGRLKKHGVEILVISTETNPVVAARCRKLGLESIQGCDDKLAALKRVAADRELDPGRIAYVGNDVNDLECLGWVGTPIAVADAMPEALRAARLVTRNRGGAGAVREAADWLYHAQGGAPDAAETQH